MTRVWLPDPPETVASLQPLPDGIEADVWTGGEPLPGSKDEVEFIVLPMGSRPAVLAAVTPLPKLKVIQLLSAGAEQIAGHIPAGITLCNARGAHDAATAEWTVGAIVASMRNFPRFVRAQEAGQWDFAVSESVAGKRVLIVGYGSIGAAVERRLAGWEVTVDRIARHVDQRATRRVRRHHRGARPRLRGRQGSAGPLRRWRTAAERHRPRGILGLARLTMGAW